MSIMQTEINNYKQAMDYLEATNQYGSILGLDTIVELLRRLDNPQDRLIFVHVAGTNGKGSTAAYTSYILAEAGLRVGRYSSPAVFSYWERIQITDQNGTNKITEDSVVLQLKRIKAAADAMVADGFHHPTIFEIETVLAFLEFVKQNCDIVVLEVGMGGKLDATNVIKNTVVAIITAISMDHMQFLGDTLEKIAMEKAGIIKESCQVVSYQQEKTVAALIEQAAKEQHAVLTIADFDQIGQVSHSLDGITMDYGSFKSLGTVLLGEHQVKNVAVAVEAAHALQRKGYAITKEMIYAGIRKAKWPGRLEVLEKKPYFLIDGAHNEAAALSLRNSMELYFSGRRKFYIMGVFADKDYEGILANTADLAEQIFTITAESPRALPSKELAKVAKKYCNKVTDAGTVENAIRLCKQQAGEEDVIIAFGSLSYLGEICSLLAKEPMVAGFQH